MNIFILIVEITGTVAFSVSGTVIGLKKNMDLFGVVVLGLITAVGGGIMRDLVLGITPPTTFVKPLYAFIAIITSLIFFIPIIRKMVLHNYSVYEITLLIMDSIGLGIFTVIGVKTAFDSLSVCNYFLVISVGTLTGVGGGVIRDILAGDKPYIFVKHIYASASICGTVLCALIWNKLPEIWSMTAGASLVVLIRFLSAHYRWSLPKAKEYIDF